MHTASTEQIHVGELYALVSAESALSRIGHIQKPVNIRVLIEDSAHESSIGRDVSIHKDENRLFSRELDSLTNHIHKLTHSQVGGDKVFLLVNVGNIRLCCLFTDDRDSVRVL